MSDLGYEKDRRKAAGISGDVGGFAKDTKPCV
jgi:hypothetical protein